VSKGSLGKGVQPVTKVVPLREVEAPRVSAVAHRAQEMV